MAETRHAQAQKSAAAAHMKKVRNNGTQPKPKTVEELTEEAKSYAAASLLASELLDDKYAGEDDEGKNTERDLMRECIKQLTEGGKVLMENLEHAKKGGTRAVLFGHMSQSVSVRSLEELAAKANVRNGPLYEQVMRVFASRPDVKIIEIVPSHVA